ncbi:MAG: O-antigen ligase family protein, partial [Planctomycetota bacterium]
MDFLRILGFAADGGKGRSAASWIGNIDFLSLIGVTILFIPFFGLGSSIDPVLMPRFCLWATVSSVLLMCFMVRLYTTPDSIDHNVARRSIFVAFLGYLLFSAISLTKAVNITEGIYDVSKIGLSVVYLFVAAVVLGRNRNFISVLVKAVTVSATVLSAIGVYQYLRHGSIDYCATMANKNQLSSALFLMLAFCLYGMFALRSWFKAISAVASVLILVNIFLLQTRSVWLGLCASSVATVIVAIVLFAKLHVLRESKAGFLKGLLCVTAAFLVAVSLFGYFHLRSNSASALIKRIRSVYSLSHGPNRERILIWRKSLAGIEDNLILGAGAGNWKIVLPSYGLDKLTERSFRRDHFQRPHNDYIWVLFEIGILGFVCYLSIFAITLFYIFKILIRHPNTDLKLFSIFMFFGIVGYMVIAFFSFPKERIFHSALLLLMVAAIVSVYHEAFGHPKNISRPLMFALAIPSLVLVVSAMIVGCVRLNAEIHTKRALAARRAKNWPAVIAEIDKGYSILATLDPMSTPLKWYRGEANFMLGNVPQAFEDFSEAYKAHPYHIHVLNNLATCYELQANHDQAVNYYTKALEIFGQFEEALINLGATYYNSGSYEQAYQTLLRCDPNSENPKLQQY